MILRCQDCGFFVHYPRPICSQCLSESLKAEQVSGHASLYSYTITMKPWHPYWIDKVPYVLATVELDEQAGLKMPTNIIECEHNTISVGMRLEVAFRKAVEGLTLPYFKPEGA